MHFILAMNKMERLLKSADLLRTFVVVAERENITHAADVLGRTQSAISVQVSKLEETLEVRLFDRKARGMTLTSDGDALLPVARKIMRELESVGTLFQDPLQGRIRVGIPHDYADAILEAALVEFSRRHPLVEVSAQFGCTATFPEEVRRGVLDVAVVSDTSLPGFHTLGTERNVWAASSNMQIDTDQPTPLAVLDRRSCGWSRLAPDALDSIGREWRLAYASESFAGVKAAIRSGLAIGALPEALMEPGMIALTEIDGFPDLGRTARGAITSRDAPENLATAMIEAIDAAANVAQRCC